MLASKSTTVLARTVCCLLLLGLCSVSVVAGATRPPGLMGKVAMTLAGRVIEIGHPGLIEDLAVVLESGLLPAVEARHGIPWDLAEWKRNCSLAAMEGGQAEVLSSLSRLLSHPLMTSLFPVFSDEVPVGSAQVGRVGTALAVFALRVQDRELRETVGRVLRAHVLELATKDSGEIWDVRELMGVLSSWAMQPEADAVRMDLSRVLSDARIKAAWFPVFEQ